MKTINKKTTIMTSITIATLLIATSSFMGMQNAYAPALVTNGSFELPPATCSPTFITLGNGDTTITGWTVGGNGIDWICGHWDASDGTHSLDMSAISTGTISQVLTTVVGAEYKVTFDMSGNPSGVPAVKSMTVSAADDSEDFNEDQGNASDDMAWQPKEFCFRATETTTTLEFASNDATPSGPALDNVAAELVVEIPGDGIDSNCDGLDFPTMFESNEGNFWKQISETCVDGLDIAIDQIQFCDMWITYHGDVSGIFIDTIPAHLDIFSVSGDAECTTEFANQHGKDKSDKKPRKTSATIVTCEVDPGDKIHILTDTRQSPSGKLKWSPTGCGLFEVNGGILFYEGEGPITDASIPDDTMDQIDVHTTPDDLDCDGHLNDADNCAFTANEDQSDVDGDSVGDACDICPLDNPDDTDGDGVCTSDDICEGGDDAVDADGDGVPDFCDMCPADNPDDTDGDGVCTSDDICEGGDDAVDADGDGVPDFCDICDGDDFSEDTDGDLVCDDIDPQDDDACIPDNQDPLCET